LKAVPVALAAFCVSMWSSATPPMALAAESASSEFKDSSTRVFVKDPAVAEHLGGELLFGARAAHHYLEIGSDGSTRSLPSDMGVFDSQSTVGSYFVMGLWALCAGALLYQLSTPQGINGNQNGLVGLITASLGVTWVHWRWENEVVAPVYRNLTIKLNRGEQRTEPHR